MLLVAALPEVRRVDSLVPEALVLTMGRALRRSIRRCVNDSSLDSDVKHSRVYMHR